jgi:hypothetical protein
MKPCFCSTSASQTRHHALPTYRYTARGERVDSRGGTYWIPAHEFHGVVARSRHCPAILNDYPFEPLPSRGECE